MPYGPGVYQPTAAKKLAALESYSQIVSVLLPKEPVLTTGHLWHNDLHLENIYVNPANPREILGIIDWQSVQIMPLFDHCLDPDFIGYEGPDVGEDLEPPIIPKDVDDLDPPDRAIAIKQFYTKCLVVAWRTVVKAKNPTQYSATQFRGSKAGHLGHLVQNIAVLGEAHARALLLDVRDEWSQMSSGPKFPTEFSEDEVTEIENDVQTARKRKMPQSKKYGQTMLVLRKHCRRTE